MAFSYCMVLDVVTIELATVAAGVVDANTMSEQGRYASIVIVAEGVETLGYITKNLKNVTTAEVDEILYTLYSK